MNTIPCPDLAEAIAFFTEKLGFRLDMIMPADSPRIAVVSRDGLDLRLEQVEKETPREFREHSPQTVICPDNESQWIVGRAGMEYRDLIPNRLGGLVIASHIRLTHGGEVPDYVHYHKIGFQVIYCKAGRIRVLYQDQGPAFWLEPGDCVLQPPEIRHRVLEAEAGSEVVELGCPALHETWVDHETKLPSSGIDPERDFGGQRFVRHIAKNAALKIQGDLEVSDTGVSSATRGSADFRVVKNVSDAVAEVDTKRQPRFTQFYFVLAGTLTVTGDREPARSISANDSLTIFGPSTSGITADPQTEFIQVNLALDEILGRSF